MQRQKQQMVQFLHKNIDVVWFVYTKNKEP